MPILKPIFVIAGLSFLVLVVPGFIRALVRIRLGRASGIGLAIPNFLRGIPPALQIPVMLFGIPLTVGIVGGCLWQYFVSH